MGAYSYIEDSSRDLIPGIEEAARGPGPCMCRGSQLDDIVADGSNHLVLVPTPTMAIKLFSARPHAKTSDSDPLGKIPDRRYFWGC